MRWYFSILLQGEPLCIFYSRYGICKFGPNCKFDHPMGTVTYNLSVSPTADISAVPRLLGSFSGSPGLTLTPELSLSESRQMTSVEENSEAEGSHTAGQVSSFS